MLKIIYLVTILVNKTAIIDNSYAGSISLDVLQDDISEHTNSIFTTLFFLPKFWLLPETAMKLQANTYFVFVLMDKTITTRNFYTQYALLNVSNATEPR